MSKTNKKRKVKPSDLYKTPIIFNRLLDETMGGCDLDPCGAADGNNIIRARRYINEIDDIPTPAPWRLKDEPPLKVFMNPPFSMTEMFVERFVSYYASGDMEAGIILGLNNVLHNKGTQELIARYMSAACLWHGRMSFLPGCPENATENGFNRDVSAIYFGEDPDAFDYSFSPYGLIVVQRTPRSIITVL